MLDTVDLDSPRRIYCAKVSSPAEVPWFVLTGIDFLVVLGSPAGMRVLVIIMFACTCNILVCIHQFLGELSKVHDNKLVLRS